MDAVLDPPKADSPFADLFPQPAQPPAASGESGIKIQDGFVAPTITAPVQSENPFSDLIPSQKTADANPFGDLIPIAKQDDGNPFQDLIPSDKSPTEQRHDAHEAMVDRTSTPMPELSNAPDVFNAMSPFIQMGADAVRTAAPIAGLLGATDVEKNLRAASELYEGGQQNLESIITGETQPGTKEKLSPFGRQLGSAAGMLIEGAPVAIAQMGINAYDSEMQKSGDPIKAAKSVVRQAPELALYWLASKFGATALKPFIKDAPAIIKALAGAGTATVTNTLSSAAIRAANAEPGHRMEDAQKWMSSLPQDALFGLVHGIEQARSGSNKGAAQAAATPISDAATKTPDLTPEEAQKVATSPVPETEKAVIAASKTSTAPASGTEPLTSVGNKPADIEGVVDSPENKIASTAIKVGDTVHSGDEPLFSHNEITTKAAKSGVDVTDGERGFVDQKGNFIDRPTAAKTALDAGQIDQPTYDRIMARYEPGLQSEDLKPDPAYVGGPGAMGPVEAQAMTDAKKPVSIKNAQVDATRVARGMEPTMAPARQAMGKVWDDAMTKIDSDPSYPSRMVDDILSDKKTKVSDEDHAALLHEQITLQNAKQQETERALDPNSSEGDRAEARIKYAALEDQLRRTEEAGRKIGTISGRALQIRQMMANDDYTLAAMEANRRIAKGDRPLTPEESVKIKQQSDRIADLEKQLSERQNTSKDRGSKEAGDEAVKNLKDEANRTPKKGRDIEAERLSTIDKLKSRVAKGEKIQDMDGLVQKLALHFVEQGIKERQPLVDAVHEVLKSIVPDITPRETMDAISGYGEFKQLSKEETKVQLRDLKGQMQQAAKIEDMNNQIPPKKTGVERRTPSDLERRMIKEVNDLKKKGGFNVTDPETQLKSALQAFKTRTENRIKDLQQKLDTGDFSKMPRRELKLDEEAMKLKAESERIKLSFDRGSMAERLKTRTSLEKTLDAIPKWSRFALLSNPITLAKLTMAAIYRVGSSPLEEAIGSGLSKLIPDVAARAPKEGGGSIRVEAKALTDGLTKGFKDSYDVLTKGKSDLESAYGKRDVLPASPVVDFFGHLHGALKAPVKRIAFSRSMQKQMEFGMAHGVDVTDPFVQMKIATEAYKDANLAIFMQDNRVVSAYKAALATMERPDKSTGKISLGSKLTTATAKTLLPIVKIPTNIVAETFKYATGSVTGSARLALAFKNGVENLKPEEADLIMRDLKKGSIGAAVLLLGYLNPQVIGGYYQKGQKQNPNDPKYGDVKLYGNEIPKSLLHAPLVEQLQLGSTMRKAADSKLKSSDQQTQGVPAGVMAGFLGLTSEVPFVGNLLEINKVFSSPQDRNKYFGELANSRLVPQAIQYIAKLTDKDAKGEPVKRDPQTVMQNVEAGIPGLRQNVPVKAGKPSTPHMLHIRK